MKRPSQDHSHSQQHDRKCNAMIRQQHRHRAMIHRRRLHHARLLPLHRVKCRTGSLIEFFQKEYRNEAYFDRWSYRNVDAGLGCPSRPWR
jgi:hypothetical protein